MAWQRELDLSAFIDDQLMTCSTITFFDVHLQSIPILVTTEAFKSLQLQLSVKNLYTESTSDLDLPLLVLTQTSELEPGHGSWQPFGGVLVKCDLLSKPDIASSVTVVTIQYLCHCQVHRCQGVAVHIPRTAVLDPRIDVGLCHIAPTVL